VAISLTDVQTSSESVYSDLGKTIVDGTREKRDCLPSLLEQKHISLFYCNSRKAILNPHQHGSETKFTAFCRFLLAARQSLRAVSALAPQRRFSQSFWQEWF
jgi:hypothetical protein